MTGRFRSRHEWPARLTAAAVLMLMLLVAVAAPVAEARAEARAAGASAHVESGTSDDCAPTHQHAACIVCRTLRTIGAPATPPAWLSWSLRPERPLAGRPDDRDRGHEAAPLHSRAPPTR